MVFLWLELERQVRINGRVGKLSAAEADEYFASRPRGSQLGALASQQSQVVANRAALDARYAALEREYHDRPIPRPDYWGGYRLQADMLEFWQGRQSRLHDRLRYRLNSEGSWRLERLQP
jgi:pyridoxamine 5'-phosphate oxidase